MNRRYFFIHVIRNRSEEELVSTWEKTLDGIKGIQKALKWYRNYPLWRELYDVTPESIQIDPEYRIWGCIGWSIRFNIVHENETTIEGYEPG